MKYKALGIHVFAGGFSGGVAREADVVHQLECHGFGLETTRQTWGIECTNSHPKDWPKISADWVFGNPRCTAFSCTTAGYDETAHGPFAKQCQDIHDLIEYSMTGEYKAIVWESVQQAYTTGRPLLDQLVAYVATKGYRVTHLLMNAHTFGNAQCRKRYFFVAHPRELPFNVELPSISSYYPVAYDALWDMRDRETHPYHQSSTEYTADSYLQLQPWEVEVIPQVPTGWCFNQVARYAYDTCNEKMRMMWDFRTSDMPFSMHCPYRPSWFRPFPTLTGTAGRTLHPWHHRPCTVGELARIMGWGDKIPVGKNPVPQLAKGVVPAAGQWLARQVHLCLDDAWGGADWEITYDQYAGEIKGHDTRDQTEKTINLTHYHGKQFDLERYPHEAQKQFHRFNVDPKTGKLIRAWDKVHERA